MHCSDIFFDNTKFILYFTMTQIHKRENQNFANNSKLTKIKCIYLDYSFIGFSYFQLRSISVVNWYHFVFVRACWCFFDSIQIYCSFARGPTISKIKCYFSITNKCITYCTTGRTICIPIGAAWFKITLICTTITEIILLKFFS